MLVSKLNKKLKLTWTRIIMIITGIAMIKTCQVTVDMIIIIMATSVDAATTKDMLYGMSKSNILKSEDA